MTALESALARLRSLRADWRRMPAAEHVLAIARLAEPWKEEGTPWLARASGLDPTPFSPPAVRLALRAWGHSLRRESLEAAIEKEIGDRDVFPLGVVTQILPGNHFMTGAISLLQCLLTRNSVVLKLPKGDPGFTSLFVESIRASPSSFLAEHIHLMPSEEATPAAIATLKRESDGIVVWGSAAAVAAFPQSECAGKVIYHGPRLGLGLAVADDEAEDFAWDIALWEQLACSSPRVILVPDGPSGVKSRRFAARLDEALSRVTGRLPAPRRSVDDKSEMLTVRETAAWAGGEVVTPPSTEAHTVIFSEKVPGSLPAGFRSVFVVPFRDREALRAILVPLRPFLQTVTTQDRGFGEDFIAHGVSQFFPPGSGLVGDLGFPHEGEFPLRRLVKVVGRGGKSPIFGRPV